MKQRRPWRPVEVAVLIVACATCVIAVRACNRLIESPRIEELRQLAAELPLYPDFKEVNTRSLTKGDRAHITKDYSSSEAPDNVEQFYAVTLAQRGFQYTGGEDGGRTANFRKGEFLVQVTDLGGSDSGGGRLYKVGFYWREKE